MAAKAKTKFWEIGGEGGEGGGDEGRDGAKREGVVGGAECKEAGGKF